MREAAPDPKRHAPKKSSPRKPDTPPPPPVSKPAEPARGTPVVDDLLADLEASGRVPRGNLGGGRRTAPAQRKLQKTSEWDSMLLLVGGASLGVLLVIGAFLYMSLTRGAAEDLFGAADTAYGDQSYSLAIRLYDEYLEAYPKHEKASLARVRREMARLRQVYKNPEQGMKVAQEVLPQIENEESFAQVRDELASMLPQIARGFVDQARLAKDPVAQESLLAKTAETMKLVDNANYIPSTLRKSQLTSIESIVDDMARVRARSIASEDLTETLGVIQSAVASGDTATAYTARQDLLNKYPGLDTDEQLLEAVLKVSERERERVQVRERTAGVCHRRSGTGPIAARGARPPCGTGHRQRDGPSRVHAGGRIGVCVGCYHGRRVVASVRGVRHDDPAPAPLGQCARLGCNCGRPATPGTDAVGGQNG